MSTTIDPCLTGPRDGRLPLAGLRVLEFCHVVMGPVCGLVLAELGAEVIKIEPVPDGDRTRNLKGHMAGSFAFFNRSKESIGIDLKTEGGRALTRRMAAQADVVTENFGPGTADRIGIGYEDLSRQNPRLVYCSLKGFLSGPYEKRVALDELVQFMTGLAYMTGPPGQPLRAGASVVDITGGLFGVIAILAALREREETGRGQKVQSALFESCAFLVGQHMAGEATSGIPSEPLSVRARAWAIYETFSTADNQLVFVGITSDKHWRAFCEAFGQKELLTSRFATNEARQAEYATLRPIVAQVVHSHSGEEVMDKLSAIGIPAAFLRRPSDLFDDPQLNVEGRMSKTALNNGKVANLPRLPIDIGPHRARMGGCVPKFAEHTKQVLERFGVSPGEIEGLREAGAIA